MMPAVTKKKKNIKRVLCLFLNQGEKLTEKSLFFKKPNPVFIKIIGF
jgi:hypothetical protein